MRLYTERKSNIYEIQTMSSNTVKSNGLPNKTVSIPKKYNNAIIQSTVDAPRYSQTSKNILFY